MRGGNFSGGRNKIANFTFLWLFENVWKKRELL